MHVTLQRLSLKNFKGIKQTETMKKVTDQVTVNYLKYLALLKLDSRHTDEILRHSVSVIDNGLLIQALKKEHNYESLD